MATSKRIVLITGANSGVGYATTQVIASASPNYHVILACRSLSNGQKAVNEIKASSSSPIKGTLSLIQCDITDEDSIISAAKSIEAEFGRLDVLINNAGVGSGGSGPHTKEKLRYMFDSNVFGPMLMIQAFQPLLEKSTYQNGPYVVQVTSGLGSFSQATDPENPFYPYPNEIYRMTKAALNMMTVQVHKELGKKKGFKVFAVCPGLVRSYLRGKSEEEVSAWGMAGDPLVSGRTILGIVEGDRDDAVGRIVHKDGVYEW